MIKILLLTVSLTAVSCILPKRGIVFPSDDELEKRYQNNKVNTKSSLTKAIIFPKDDYDNSDPLITNKVNFKHTPEYHRFDKKQRNFEGVEFLNFNGKEVTDIAFDDRFLFRSKLNCPCKMFGSCIQKCRK